MLQLSSTLCACCDFSHCTLERRGSRVDSRCPDVLLVHQIERHSSLLSGSRIAALEQMMCCSSGLRLQRQGLNNDIIRAAIKPASGTTTKGCVCLRRCGCSINRCRPRAGSQSHLALSPDNFSLLRAIRVSNLFYLPFADFAIKTRNDWSRL